MTLGHFTFPVRKMKIFLVSALLALLCTPGAASDVDDARAAMDTLADDGVFVDPYVVQPPEVADIRALNFNNSNYRTKRFLRKPDCEVLHNDVVRNESDVATIRWHVLDWACDVVDLPAHAADVSLLEKIKCQ